jgi:hypothetical protein
VTKNLTRYIPVALLLAAFLAIFGCGNNSNKAEPSGKESSAAATATEPFPACPASAMWVSAPMPPVEIGGAGTPVGSETFCQFYQFAEQWFLSLASPSTTSGSRVFETFNVVGISGATNCSANGSRLSGKEAIKKSLFVRVKKPATGDFDPTLPVNMGQAGSGDAIYDQNGNVVLYAMLYNSAECQATPAGFVPNTIEVKTSWKVLSGPDPSYYTMNATINFSTGPKNLTLGLVGFHMVINTALHPEFIWVTFEHKTNDPNCNNPQPAPASGWDFTSSQAAQCLANGGIGNCSQFKFNTGAPPTTPTGGTPTQACKTYPDGTDPVPPAVGPNGNRNGLNAFTIDTLNTQLIGPNGILMQLPASSPMAVFANYTMEGALWTNGGMDSVTANQRGSLELANTTMETFEQNPPPAANTTCFGCHQFTTTAPLTVSHIYEATPAKAAALRRRAAAAKK